MKKIKKIAAGMVVLGMMGTVLPTQFLTSLWMTEPMVTVKAAEEKGDYRYVVNEDDTVTITGYKGDKKYVSIPGSIEGKKVTTIGKNAFRNQKIIRLKLSENVTEIKEEAFANCNNLSGVTLPETLEKIGEYAFCMCNNLKQIVIPENVKKIGDGAFFYCKSLAKLDLKAMHPDMGSYIFADCANLFRVSLPEGFTEIPEGMFFRCTKLITVLCKDDFEKIGDRAFYECMRLKFFELNGITELGDNALADIGGVEELVIKTGKVGKGVLDGTEVESLVVEDTIRTGDAFEKAHITKMTLGAEVDTSIENSIRTAQIADFDVAEGNNYLSEFQDSLYNKKQTELLKYHSVPVEYQSEEEEETEGKTGLVLPEGIKRIGSYALAQYVDRQKVILPETIEEIGEGAFYNSDFEEIEIPDSVTKIKESTFSGNNMLEKVSLGGSVKVIEDEAFRNCCNLTTLTGTEKITKIDKGAFDCCETLQEFTIPDALEELGEGVFTDCAIREFHVSENHPAVKEQDGSLVTKDGKGLICLAVPEAGKNVVFPKDITTLLPQSVCLPYWQKTIVIPEGVTDIKERAILGMNGQEVTLPDSIEKIEDKAIGYTIDSSNEAQPVLNNKIYSAGMNEVAKKYALDHDITIATGTTDVNEETIELRGDETFKISVPGLLEEQTYYSSTDNEIASVSDAGVITAHKRGETYVTVYAGGCCWYAKVIVASDGTPYVSPYHVESYVKPMEDEETWLEAYMKANDSHGFTEEENINTFEYSGENAYKPMKALLKHGQEYVKKAENLYGANYKRYDQLNKNLDYELSQYTLPMDTVVYSGIRTITNFTGASESVSDMRASIGKTGEYNCITSTSYDKGICEGFMSVGRGSTMLEIYLPKGYRNGAYISPYSQFESEKEYLMGTGFRYTIMDAGVRAFYDQKWGCVKSERFMKLLVIPEEEEAEATPVPTDPPIYVPVATPTPTATATPTVTPTSTPTAIPTAAPTVTPTATPVPTATPTPKPTATPTPKATPTATPTPTGTPTATAAPTEKPQKTPAPEKTVQKTVKGVTYRVSGKKVVVVKAVKSVKEVSIPSKIEIKGKTYKVTSIQANAFANCKKIKKISMGKYITSIGKNAFKNINTKAVFKVEKKYYQRYKKILTKKTGYSKSMKIKFT